MSNHPSPDPSPSGSRSVALAYVGAALANLLFLKGIAFYLDVASFGVVAGGAALMLAVTLPSMALRAGSAAAAVGGSAAGNPAEFVMRFDRLALRVLACASAAAALLCIAPFDRWVNLPSVWIVAVSPFLAAGAILLGHSTGTVLGSGHDRVFAVLLVLEPVLRCAFAVLLGLAGIGGDGLGPLVAMLLAMTFTTLFARSRLPRASAAAAAERPRRRPPKTPVAAPSALAALASFGLLCFLDIPLVRHVLPAAEAAEFAAVAVASRFLVLLPFPLALLLVARVRRRLLRCEPPFPEMLRMLAIVAAALAVGVLIINEMGAGILGLILDADKYGHLRPFYFSYAVAASVFGVAELLLFFGVALGRVSLVLLPPVVLMIEYSELIQRGHTLGDCVTVVRQMSLLNLAMLAVVVLLPLLWAPRRVRS